MFRFWDVNDINIVFSDVLDGNAVLTSDMAKKNIDGVQNIFFPGVQDSDSDIKRIIVLIILMYTVIKR